MAPVYGHILQNELSVRDLCTNVDPSSHTCIACVFPQSPLMYAVTFQSPAITVFNVFACSCSHSQSPVHAGRRLGSTSSSNNNNNNNNSNKNSISSNSDSSTYCNRSCNTKNGSSSSSGSSDNNSKEHSPKRQGHSPKPSRARQRKSIIPMA